MGWITLEEMYPPEGLNVLLEVSGYVTGDPVCIADHDFYLGTWIVPKGQQDGKWLIESEREFISPKIHAWMPLPKHYEQNESFSPEEDMMEHAMFEDDPPELYKGNMVYEQMDLEEFLGGGQT